MTRLLPAIVLQLRLPALSADQADDAAAEAARLQSFVEAVAVGSLADCHMGTVHDPGVVGIVLSCHHYMHGTWVGAGTWELK